MNKREKEIMKKLIKLMKENNFYLDELSQVDFNIQATIIFEKIIKMDYIVPFEEV
ncbi:hypothetical protein IW492_02095 [Enterococcus sp. BWB1-3]|uniref:hypothetical protein n=1 Tax=Enterococcus sp. BWB1-3 TaxID=2787713 RepID=UPI0019231E94|nr:hypothetical protein [Enterococcus sp. BWB1-3]MBL1228021.1 hypothetical protein [Enterococcus sp. BWB1-3]